MSRSLCEVPAGASVPLVNASHANNKTIKTISARADARASEGGVGTIHILKAHVRKLFYLFFDIY